MTANTADRAWEPFRIVRLESKYFNFRFQHIHISAPFFPEFGVQCSGCRWCRTLIGTNAPGHRSRLDLYWPKKRVLPSLGIVWHHLTFGILFDSPPESAPAFTGEEPQPVDDDDADYTIPEHDEELTEKDIVKTLVLICRFLLLKWISLDLVQYW